MNFHSANSSIILTRRLFTLLALTLNLFFFAACKSADTTAKSVRPEATKKNVDIYWTDYGVPHINAKDWKSLGYGSAYAAATQNFCIIADQLLKVRSERSLYFGAGPGNANIISDVGHLALGYIEDAKNLFKNLTPRTQDLITGYAQGFNQYLAEHSPDQFPRPCKGAAWIKPTTPQELLAYYFTLAERASGTVLMPAVVGAEPPSVPGPNPQVLPGLKIDIKLKPLPNFDKFLRLGSNAWSFGSAMSENQRGLLLGNPHFPAYGSLRFYQQRLRIPGVIDVQGASLVGTPCVEIGFNDNLAWTHTVSKSRHFTMYQLELNPANPLQYKYDGQFRDINRKDIAIQLLLPTGQVVPFSRPVFFSHYGALFATPDLKWTAATAFTYRDANRQNTDFIDQWLDMGSSKDSAQFTDAFKKYRGTPWVNTIYTDRAGTAMYLEGTPVPKLSPATIAAWKAEPTAQFVYQASKAFLLQGNTSRDEWQGDLRGLTPFDEAPKLSRTDYVANQNDSHWIINENALQTGFSPIYGLEEVPQSYRTRMGLKMIHDAAGADKLFNQGEVEAAFFSDRGYLWEDLGAALKVECKKWPEPELQSACASLDAFNGRYDLDSKGFAVFREFANLWKPELHAVDFSVAKPLETPSGLKPDNADVKNLFATAVANLSKAKVNLDSSLAQLQFFLLPDFLGGTKERIPYPGGQDNEGAFNVQDWDPDNSGNTLYAYPNTAEIIDKDSNLTMDGIYPINGGSSYVMVVEFPDQGVHVRGLLSYSQSSDPDSPHFSDQNRDYADKKFHDFPHDWDLILSKFGSTKQSL